MARKVHVDLSDTINSWRQKTNTLGLQIGELDNLTSGERLGETGFTGKDSDIVQALNHVYDLAYIDSNQIKEHHIDTHAVSGRNIDSDVITSHHLAVAGLGSYSLIGGGVQYQYLKSVGDGTFEWGLPLTTNYSAGLGISKTTTGDSSGVFNVAGGHGLTQEAGGLKLEDMPANTVKVNATTSAANPTDLALGNNTLLAKVGTANIAGLSIPASTVVGRIASGDIIAAQIATTQIANNAITEIKIADDQVAYAKIQNVVTANRVLGSRTAGGPVVETLVYKEMIAAGAAVPDQTDPGTVDMVLYSDGTDAGWTKVAEANLADAVTLIIYNSAGTAVKTLYGAGS